MKTSTLAWIVLVLVIIVGGWYVWMQSAVPAPLSTTQPVATSTATTSQSAGTTNPDAIQNNLTLGTSGASMPDAHLIGYNGMTLYTYAEDSAGVSNCIGTCTKDWTPYIVPTGMQLNIQAGLTGQAGTITRTDGTTQVTYNGMPLYFYNGDAVSGETNGANVASYWYVAKP